MIMTESPNHIRALASPAAAIERRLAALALLALCAGCANIDLHRRGKAYPMCGTVENANAASEIFVERPDMHYGSPSEAAIAHAYAVVFSPVLLPCLLVDLPFEVVADVVTLPVDL